MIDKSFRSLYQRESILYEFKQRKIDGESIFQRSKI